MLIATKAETVSAASITMSSVPSNPVSYTHLDVYKRQARRRPHFIEAVWKRVKSSISEGKPKKQAAL